MTTRPITLKTVLIYPHVLNPVSWLALIILIIYLIIAGWYSIQTTPAFNLYFNRTKRIRTLRELFIMICTITINSVWYSPRKAKAYATYLTSICIPFYPFNDYRTQKAIDADYKYYQSLR